MKDLEMGKCFQVKFQQRVKVHLFFWLELAGVWACTREAHALTTIPAE